MQQYLKSLTSLPYFAPVATTVGLAMGFALFRWFRNSSEPVYGNYFSPSYQEARIKFLSMLSFARTASSISCCRKIAPIVWGELGLTPLYCLSRQNGFFGRRTGDWHCLDWCASSVDSTCSLAGSRTPKRVIFHSSGVHGVEGYAGSAIQLQFLRSLMKKVSDSITGWRLFTEVGCNGETGHWWPGCDCFACGESVRHVLVEAMEWEQRGFESKLNWWYVDFVHSDCSLLEKERSGIVRNDNYEKLMSVREQQSVWSHLLILRVFLRARPDSFWN